MCLRADSRELESRPINPSSKARESLDSRANRLVDFGTGDYRHGSIGDREVWPFPNGAFISDYARPQAFRRTNPPPRLRTRESVAVLSFGMVPAPRRTNREPP